MLLGVVQVVIGYLLAGAMRGVALTQLLELNPAIEDGGLIFRVATSVITMSTTVAILTFAQATYQSHRLAITELTTETEQLRQTLLELERDSSKRDQTEAQAIAKRIVNELNRIELYPAKEQILEIQNLINNQVRPLSKEYAIELKRWIPEQTRQKRLTFRDIWAKVDLTLRFNSFWFLVALSLTPVPATLADYGLQAGIEIAVFTFAALSTSVWIGFKVSNRIVPRLRSPWQEIVFTALLVLMAFPGVAATYLALSDTPNPNTYVAIGLISFPAFAWILTLGSNLLTQLRETRTKLTEVEAQLRWAIARVNLLSWYSRGVVTRLLHGPIQNSMHISLIKMQNTQDEILVEDAIAELTARIEAASLESNQQISDKSEPELLLREAAAIWSEVAEVGIELEGDVSKQLSKDQPAGSIVVDLCNELLSNAIRHGKASKVQISLAAEPTLIKVRVQHNGQTQPQRSDHVSAGLGTKFLDSCSIRWESSRSGELTTTDIQLPLSL